VSGITEDALGQILTEVDARDASVITCVRVVWLPPDAVRAFA
jgi:hypothetical protein